MKGNAREGSGCDVLALVIKVTVSFTCRILTRLYEELSFLL